MKIHATDLKILHPDTEKKFDFNFNFTYENNEIKNFEAIRLTTKEKLNAVEFINEILEKNETVLMMSEGKNVDKILSKNIQSKMPIHLLS